jgi:hypothetical protein
MPWLPDRAGPAGGSRQRRQQCRLPPFRKHGHPEALISRLNSLACTYPCQRFAASSPNANA